MSDRRASMVRRYTAGKPEGFNSPADKLRMVATVPARIPENDKVQDAKGDPAIPFPGENQKQASVLKTAVLETPVMDINLEVLDWGEDELSFVLVLGESPVRFKPELFQSALNLRLPGSKEPVGVNLAGFPIPMQGSNTHTLMFFKTTND